MSRKPFHNGDEGVTDLIGGKRLPKNHAIFNALGDIDELNSLIGIHKDIQRTYWSLVFCWHRNSLRARVKNYLHKLQSILIIISSHIAGLNSKFDSSFLIELDYMNNILDKNVPVLKTFLLPNNPYHHIRTVARRAERTYSGLEVRDDNILKFLNRLSDFFFVLGRYFNYINGMGDTSYKSMFD